jgi:hypothetical protein
VDVLDEVLPRFDVRERHELRTELPPEVALARLLALPVAPDSLVRLLFRLRGLGSGDVAIADFATARLGLTEVRRAPQVVVYGPPRQARIAIAIAFWAEPDGAGSLLGTETRVAMRGTAAKVLFRLYWLAVGPCSALIRRRWLRAATRA